MIILKYHLLFWFLLSGLVAQDFFDEMEIVDISNAADVKTSIVRSPDQALLIVKTQIPGIRIESNNVIIRRKQVENGVWHIFVKPGTHRMVFQAEGFISVKQRISFNPKDVKGRQLNVIPVDADADKNSGRLVLSSNPNGADVYINGDFFGITPFLGKLLAGNYKLEVKKELYLSFEETIIIRAGQTYPLNVDIVPNTLVEITSNPQNATVYMDGEKLNTTPLTLKGIHFGKHVLRAELEGHVDAQKEFEVSKADEQLKIQLNLPRKIGTLGISGSPYGANIWIDGIPIGTIPLKEKKLDFGEHLLEIQSEGYLLYSKNIVVNRVEPYQVQIKLQPKDRNTALFYSALIPGAGQYYLDQELKGFIISAVTLGCAASALLLNSNYADQEKTYFNNKKTYEANIQLSQMAPLYDKVISSYDKMESTANTVKILSIAAAVVWAYNIADIFIFAPDTKMLSLNVETDQNKTTVALTVNF